MVPKALQGLLWVGKAQHDKHQGLSNGIETIARAIVGWESSTWQTNKTNQQPSTIDSYNSFYSLKGSRLQRLNPNFGMYLNLILQYLGEECLLDASNVSCSNVFYKN